MLSERYVLAVEPKTAAMILNVHKEVLGMAYDPVCKMEVSENETQYTSQYGGKTYYFCSSGCKTEFDAYPERFATAESAAGTIGVEGGAAGYGASASAKGKASETYQKFRESQTYQKALGKGHELTDKAKGQARTMIDKQRDRSSSMLGSVASALRQTAQQLQSQEQGSIARYADSAAAKVDQLSGYLRDKDADQLISEAERMVRRRPAVFLGGAFALGFALSRFLKSSGMRAGSPGGHGGSKSYSAGMSA